MAEAAGVAARNMDPVVVQHLAVVLEQIEALSAEAGVHLLCVVAAEGADGTLECGRSVPSDTALADRMVTSMLMALPTAPREEAG